MKAKRQGCSYCLGEIRKENRLGQKCQEQDGKPVLTVVFLPWLRGLM